MADVLAVRGEYRAQTLAMLIQECNNSGQTKREFCQQRGISEKSFYYWLWKLRSHMSEAASPQLVQLEPPAISDDMCRSNIGAQNGSKQHILLPKWLFWKIQSRVSKA